MFNRTVMLLSVSLAIIIVSFTFLSLYIAYNQGVFNSAQFKINSAFISYIVFVLFMVLGAIITFIAYKKQSNNLLVFATLFYIFSAVPSLLFPITRSSDAFIFLKLCATPTLLNILQLIILRNKR